MKQNIRKILKEKKQSPNHPGEAAYKRTLLNMLQQSVAWGLSPSLVGLAQKTISETRVPRVSFQRSSFVIAYLVCVTFGGSGGDLFCHGRYRKSLGREIGET